MYRSGQEIPVPSTVSSTSVATAPPKRFLGASTVTAHLCPPRRLAFPVLSPSLLSASPSSEGFSGLPVAQLHPSSPPKLTRFPTVLLTPVDITQVIEKGTTITRATGDTELARPIINKSLLRPPPLIKMPVSRKKETRSPVVVVPMPRTSRKRNEGSESETSVIAGGVEEADKPLEEPLRKRARGATAEKTGENSRGSGGSTPRKIIQEIFGPDKSKRPKGKGRKKRKGVTVISTSAVIPKKKILAEIEECDVDDTEEIVTVSKEHEGEDEGATDEGEIQLDEEDEEEVKDSVASGKEEEAENTDANQDKAMLKKELKSLKPVVEEKEKLLEEMFDKTKRNEKNKKDTKAGNSELGEEKEEQIELDDSDCEMSGASSTVSFQESRRNTNVVAKRFTRFSENDEFSAGGENHNDPTLIEEEKMDYSEQGDGESISGRAKGNDDEENFSHEEETRAAGTIQSRRSTTDCSSKSGSSSLAQADSESSAGAGGNGRRPNNSRLLAGRQLYNATPSSTVSDDEEEDEEVDAEANDSGSEDDDGPFHSHKDSDLESTYSWKPVRAAAAVALEQVTKNQGAGESNGLPGDAEAKAAAAAERRARKVNRYKGRNRRTLMFKSGSSKKHTAHCLTRYSAVPTITHKLFHKGQYFQTGDLVYVELADGAPIYGQIRGLMMDHFGETSAGIRFLAPKHPVYSFMDFDPINYSFRYDIPERLIKIDFVNFVMHLNLDHFEGQPSYSKIEKNSVYTRMGKPLQKSYQSQYDQDSVSKIEDEDSTTDTSTSSSDSDDEKEERKEGQGRRSCHISDSSSTDEEDINNAAKPSVIGTIPTIEKQHEEVVGKDNDPTIHEHDDVNISKSTDMDETPD